MVSTNPESIVLLEEVRKTYLMGGEEVHALAGVSLKVERGVFCAIMGPSGSGKSTMLNLLGCLDRPTSGRYTLAGQDIGTLNDDRLSELRLKYLGFVFQSFNLIPQLTVRENIELPLFYLGYEAAECAKLATELAGRVGLGNRVNHRPTELSGGQQQRVAVARALANDPQLILADEPTGNLDSATGKQVMELLVDLNAHGKTIVMVTHEPDIAAYAQRRIHMLDGVIDRVEENA
ncbi:MAG: ABC transporter ATP-binding protein [Candidatus Hydrogenedentes bacterium]|nr:ABC transporter ATP-binding protein [Candidatus Hydrogenedentota bacterium]